MIEMYSSNYIERQLSHCLLAMRTSMGALDSHSRNRHPGDLSLAAVPNTGFESKLFVITDLQIRSETQSPTYMTLHRVI